MLERTFAWLEECENTQDEDVSETIYSTSHLETQKGFGVLRQDMAVISDRLSTLLPQSPIVLDHRDTRELDAIADDLKLALSIYRDFLDHLGSPAVSDDACPICHDPIAGQHVN